MLSLDQINEAIEMRERGEARRTVIMIEEAVSFRLSGLLLAFLLVVQQRGIHEGRWDTIDRRTSMRGVE